MISSSGPATGPNDRETPGAHRPTTDWVAHLALILASVAVAANLAARGDRNLLRELSIGVLIVLALLFVAQIVIARRTGGASGNGTPYAFCAAGALCMLVAKFVAADSLMIAVTILSMLCFVTGIVALVFQIQRVRRSQ